MSLLDDGLTKLPDRVRPLRPEETFVFGCHPGVTCFTDCCRELELALTPYDVLGLRQGLAISSTEFLDRHVVIERHEGDFPRLYLGMVDDGRASCPFVGPAGCRLYDHRPGACRAYPLGRAALRVPDGSVRQFHVLLREPHCRGFAAGREQTATAYAVDQGLAVYNEFNDALTAILHHPERQAGRPLAAEQAELFILALYDLDGFRQRIETREPEQELPPAGEEAALLRFAMGWLQGKLYDDHE